MNQSNIVNGGISSPTSPKTPPPLPANPPRSLPPRTGKKTTSSSSSLSPPTSPTPERLSQQDSETPMMTADIAPPKSSPPARPVPPLRRRTSVPSPQSSTSPVSGIDTVLSVCLRSSPVRQPSGSLLSLGRRDAMQHSTEVKADNGTVYRRNASGVYFQIEQAWTSFDDSAGLEIGDEVLAVDNYKMVDLSLDTARMLLEDQARSGCVTLTVVRSPPDHKTKDKFDSVVVAPQSSQQQYSREEASDDAAFSPTSPSASYFTVDLFRDSSDRALGISIFGGSDTINSPSTVIIENLTPDGLAASDGRLRAGDEIISINGTPVNGLTHAEVLGLIECHHGDTAPICIAVRRHVVQRRSGAVDTDATTPRAPPRRRKSNVESSRTSRSISNIETMPAKNDGEGNAEDPVPPERQKMHSQSQENVFVERSFSGDTNPSPVPDAAENETETKPLVTTDIGNNSRSDDERSQPRADDIDVEQKFSIDWNANKSPEISAECTAPAAAQHTDATSETEMEPPFTGTAEPGVYDLCNNEQQAPLDWNANKSTEIVISTNCTGELNAMPATEPEQEVHESRVQFSSDEESVPVEVTEENDETTAASAAVVLVTVSNSAPPVADDANDDDPPPLPASLPPTSPLQHDSSQLELSLLVKDDPHSTTNPEAVASHSDVNRNQLVPDTELGHSRVNDEDLGDKYCALSEEEQLLVQRILTTTKKRQSPIPPETAKVEEHALTGDSVNSDTEEKYSDLSECERKLIENTLSSLGRTQSEVRNDVGAATSTPLDLQTQECVDQKKECEDGLETDSMNVTEERLSYSSQDKEQEQEGDTDVSRCQNVSNTAAEEIISCTITHLQESSQDEDQNADESKDVKDMPNSIKSETEISTEIIIQESRNDEYQEADENISQLVNEVSVEAEEAKTSEFLITAEQTGLVVTTSTQDDVSTSVSTEHSTINPVNVPRDEHGEEPSSAVASEVDEVPACVREEIDSANLSSRTTTVPPDDVNKKENYEGGFVEAQNERYSETTADVAISSQVVDEIPERDSACAITVTSGNEPAETVFSTDEAHADTHGYEKEPDALSKSRRTLLSDESVSGILRDYYTVDVEIAEVVEEQKPEKPKPVKPLIAQALLPKASRRLTGTLDSGATPSGFGSNKPGYGQVEIPQAITMTSKSESDVKATDDVQQLTLAIGQYSNDVKVSRDSSSSEAVRRSNIGVDKATDDDVQRTDGQEVPTVAGSRAFFKFREAALKNSSQKSSVAHSNPIPESSSTTAFNLTQAQQQNSFEGRKQMQSANTSLSQAQAESALLKTTNQGELEVTASEQVTTTTAATDALSTVAASSQPVDVTPSTASPDVQTEITNVTESRLFFELNSKRSGGGGGTALTGRPSLSTRWTPKPFSLATQATKSTPTFVTFEPTIMERDDLPANRSAKVVKVECEALSAPTKSSPFVDSAKTDVESAAIQSKPELTTTATAGTTRGSSERSSAKTEEEQPSKRSDVELNATGRSRVTDRQVSEFQSSHHDTHPSQLSAAAMATDLKKKGPMRMSSTSVPIHSRIEQPHRSTLIGRSLSTSQADVHQSKSLSNGSKWTSRGPSTLDKSWTRKMALSSQPEATNSTASADTGERNNKAQPSEIHEVEHIDVASSKAFFRAAEQAEKQALNQLAAKKSTTKVIPATSVKTSDPSAKERPSVETEVFPSPSSDSSYSAHSAPSDTTSHCAAEETPASPSSLGPAHLSSFVGPDINSKSKAWKQFMSNYSSVKKEHNSQS